MGPLSVAVLFEELPSGAMLVLTPNMSLAETGKAKQLLAASVPLASAAVEEFKLGYHQGDVYQRVNEVSEFG